MAHYTRYIIKQTQDNAQDYVGHPQKNMTHALLELERLVSEGYDRKSLEIIEVPA